MGVVAALYGLGGLLWSLYRGSLLGVVFMTIWLLAGAWIVAPSRTAWRQRQSLRRRG